MEKKRLTASEREALVRLSVALEILIGEPKHLTARAALVPGAKRDMAMMASRIRKLMEGFTATIPPEQLLIYRRALQMASYTVGVRRPGEPRDEKDYGIWLPWEVMNVLLQGCHDHCMMCDLDKGQRRACPLKKALDTIPNDQPDRSDGDCPYYTLV